MKWLNHIRTLELHAISKAIDGSLEIYQKSLAILTKVLGENYHKLATSFNLIGEVCKSKEDYQQALVWYQKSLDLTMKEL